MRIKAALRKHADTIVKNTRARAPKEITSETYQIKLRDNGKTLLLNRPAGMTLTLPPDTTFVGFTVKMIVKTAFTGTWEITCETDGDLFFGGIANVSESGSGRWSKFCSPNGTSHDTFKADSNSKGRLEGGWVEFTLLGPNEWLVTGTTHATGGPTNAFANT